MEINITQFFNEAPHSDYSASQLELGRDAGMITWSNACADSNEYLLLKTPEVLACARQFLAGFGAWSNEELEAMSDLALNALLIQLIAGDIRDAQSVGASDWDWDEYEELALDGLVSARLFCSDEGEIFYGIWP